MQIDPAALSRTDSASNPAKSAAQNAPAAAKSSRALISVPRLDLEHAYTDLKAAIGDHWAEYKESTALFLLGMTDSARAVLRFIAHCSKLQLSRSRIGNMY